MNAPNYATIFNVEDAVESAIKTILGRLGVLAFMQRDSTALPRARVDVQLQVGRQREHRTQVSPGQFCRDAWDCRLIFNVFTDRLESTGDGQRVPAPPATHGNVRGTIRYAVEYFASKFTATELPWHVLAQITQINTDPTVNVEDDLDVSSLQYEVVVGIRTGTWPVPT